MRLNVLCALDGMPTFWDAGYWKFSLEHVEFFLLIKTASHTQKQGLE